MEIIQFSLEKLEEWDKFCSESNDAWFWHTSAWLDYTSIYKPELQTKNLSFFVYGKDSVRAIVPLTLEVHSDGGKSHKEFSFGGWTIPAPALNNDLDEKEREETHKYVFEEIDRLAHEHEVVRSSFRLSPLAPTAFTSRCPYNILMKYGYSDISLNTQIIDLGKPEKELWNNLRRNHRRNILEGKEFQVRIYTFQNITEQVFSEYKEMHHKAAGRMTRPKRTFELMYKWLKRGWGFLAAVEMNGRKIGFEYYTIFKNNVYGFSAANDPDLGRLPIRHSLEWEAILWMKQQKLQLYEIGMQQYSTLPYDFPDAKQLNISHFKKGFGGFTAPFFMGEKFYDKKFCLDLFKSRMTKFAHSVDTNNCVNE